RAASLLASSIAASKSPRLKTRYDRRATASARSSWSLVSSLASAKSSSACSKRAQASAASPARNNRRRPGFRVRSQPCRPLERGGLCGEAAAGARFRRRLVQRGGNVLVGGRGRHGLVPGATVGLGGARGKH